MEDLNTFKLDTVFDSIDNKNNKIKDKLNDISKLKLKIDTEHIKKLSDVSDNLNHVLKSSTVINKNKDYRVHDISRKNKILLYEGLPGIDCGVANINASSYFDRLWQGHQQRRRFFLALSKQ